MAIDPILAQATAAMRKLTGKVFCSYCRTEKPAEQMRKVKNRWTCPECSERRKRK